MLLIGIGVKMKGWYGNSQKHALASRGVLVTYQQIPSELKYGKMTVNEKRTKGKEAEWSVIEMINRAGFSIENVSESNKGYGDALIRINNKCGKCMILLEIKETEEFYVDKHGNTTYGKPAIRLTGHRALMENADRINAVPLYLFKINSMIGNDYRNDYYWMKAEVFNKRINKKKTGIYLQPTLDEIMTYGNPVDDKFEFFLKECNREMCDD